MFSSENFSQPGEYGSESKSPKTRPGRIWIHNIFCLVEEEVFKKSNLLIGSNANEVLEDLINFLPEVNKDAVQLELDDEAMQSAFRRTFPRYA